MYTTATRVALGTKCKTGEKCPESGVWKVDDAWASTTAPIAKGNTFPPYNNKAVYWVLIRYA